MMKIEASSSKVTDIDATQGLNTKRWGVRRLRHRLGVGLHRENVKQTGAVTDLATVVDILGGGAEDSQL